MRVRSGKERSDNNVQANHCVVDCFLCPLLCATQKQEPHREVQSSRGSWSLCMVYIPTQQPLSCVHVLAGSIPNLRGTKMSNASNWATWGEAHVFPIKPDLLGTKTLSFWFTAPPLVRVLKRKLGAGRARGGFPPFPGTPHRGTRKEARWKHARDNEMLMQEIMTGGSKRRKTGTEQGSPQRLWEEEKEQREEAGDKCVHQPAPVVAPRRAQHMGQEKNANDALRQYWSNLFQLRDMKAFLQHKNILPTENAAMKP